MLYSTLLSRRLRTFAAMICGAHAVLGLAPAPAHADRWQWQPWVTLSSGYENDRVIDPDLDFLTVPGGGFFDILPGVTAYRNFGKTRVGLAGQGSYEQFVNDQNRSLYSVAGNADVRGVLLGPWRWRVNAAGNYYAESDRESVNRASAGADMALRYAAPRWYLEAHGGGDGRRYDNLLSIDDAGVEGVYTEKSASAGVAGSVLVLRGLAIAAGVSRRYTDARSAAFDAVSTTRRASVEMQVGRAGWFSLSGIGQLREFDSRDPGADSDDYYQIGASYAHRLSGTVVFTTRYAFGRYSQPLLPDQDTHRVSLGVTIRFGGTATPVPATRTQPREDDIQRFRVHAPGATRVALVGDFNGWDPSRHIMTRGADGWWEIGLRLPVGTHQYAYSIDGATATPRDAEVTVDDGFGGRNGVVTIVERNE